MKRAAAIADNPRERTTRSRFGTITFPVGEDMSARVLATADDCPHLHLMLALLKEGDTVLDTSAHVGAYALAFAGKVGPAGRVEAWEPNETHFRLLTRNIEANKADALHARHATPWAADATQSASGSAPANGAGKTNGAAKEAGKTPAEARCVDDVAQGSCALIRVAGGGHALAILDGAENTIRSHRPFVHVTPGSLEEAWDVVERLRRWNYDTQLHTPSGHRGGGSSQGILGVPDEKPLPADLVVSLDLSPVEGREALARALLAAAVGGDNRSSAARAAGERLPSASLKDDDAESIGPPPRDADDALTGDRDDRVLAMLDALSRENRLMFKAIDALGETADRLAFGIERNAAEIGRISANVQRLSEQIANLEAAGPGKRRSAKSADAVSALGRGLSVLVPRRQRETPALTYGRNSEPGSGFRMFADRCEVSPARFVFDGWAFFETSPLVRIDARLHGPDGEQVTHRIAVSHGHERGDVQESWQMEAGRYSGLVANVPAPPFKARKLELKFTAADGTTASADVEVQRMPVPYIDLARAAWRAGTIDNILLASRWILTGKAGHLIRELYGLVEDRKPPAVDGTLLTPALSHLLPAATPFAPPARPVDIIIPVYNGIHFLRPLFESVKRNTTPPYRLLVVNDASPDAAVQPLLEELLKEFDGLDGVETPELLVNEKNLGFVGTVNRAARHAKHDFVLLNTDTMVPPNWLERLMEPIFSDPAVASTTPFSNAATVCSFPEICTDNKMFAGLDVEAVDAAFARIDPDAREIELASGVGFCMGVSLDAWKRIGALDEQAFGKGYGEENDWCLRARAAGLRNMMVTNLFIQHEHGGSFESEERKQLIRDHLAIIDQRYPSYGTEVQDFIRDDHPRDIRALAALLLAGSAAGAQKPLVVIDHNLGGGATAYREEMVASRMADGQPVLVVYAQPSDAGASHPYGLALHMSGSRFDFSYDRLDELDALFADVVRPGEIFYNNLVSFRAPLDAVAFVTTLAQRSRARLTVSLHDFYPVCPSYTLLDHQGAFCGVPQDLSVCRNCLPRNRHATNPEQVGMQRWRAVWGELLEQADTILCFSQDSRGHLLRAYPQVERAVEVRPHTLSVTFPAPPEIAPGGALNIGVVGGISYQKGADVVVALAKHLAKADPAARITVIGTLNADEELPNITVTGRYDPEELPALIEAHKVNACLMPAIWPETFSYVTAELMALDMPILAFDIGAPAERLRDYPRGVVVPLKGAGDTPEMSSELHRNLISMISG